MVAEEAVVTSERIIQEFWLMVLNGTRFRIEFGKPEADITPDPQSVSRLVEKVNSSIEGLKRSPFYARFSAQLKHPEFRKRFSRLLGSSRKIKMVVYGIGSIEYCDYALTQLCLAILLRRDVKIKIDIEVFDPVISSTESRVFESFGCKMISINEEGKRSVEIEPILFFMPHCDTFLYDNVLQANWRPDLLRKIAILGNSFRGYSDIFSYYNEVVGALNLEQQNKRKLPRSEERYEFISEARELVDEFELEVYRADGLFRGAFGETSWHFFERKEDKQQKKNWKCLFGWMGSLMSQQQNNILLLQ